VALSAGVGMIWGYFRKQPGDGVFSFYLRLLIHIGPRLKKKSDETDLRECFVNASLRFGPETSLRSSVFLKLETPRLRSECDPFDRCWAGRCLSSFIKLA